MNFSEALSHLKDGGEACRSGWVEEKGGWVLLRISSESGGVPRIFFNTPTNKIIPWHPSLEDLSSDDWSVVSKGGAFVCA